MKTFASDNYSAAHPAVLAKLQQINVGQAPAYGQDDDTKTAIATMQAVFQQQCSVYFTTTGSAANVIALQLLCQPYSAVICAKSAHINEHECGAPEHHIGIKLLPVATRDGKLTPALIEDQLANLGDAHCVQPTAISISQPTECGTVYSLAELQALTTFARSKQLYVHMDGARIANAVVHLNCSIADMTTNLGIDIISFGGSKNGLIAAEAVVILNPQFAASAKYIHKQAMQLTAKMRFISSQFSAYFADDLWLHNAKQANAMASLLATELRRFNRVQIQYAVDANMVFVSMPENVMTRLQQHYPFYRLPGTTALARLVTAFDYSTQDVEELLAQLRQLLS